MKTYTIEISNPTPDNFSGVVFLPGLKYIPGQINVVASGEFTVTLPDRFSSLREWSSVTTYTTGQQTTLDNRVYEAKGETTGDTPDPDGTPFWDMIYDGRLIGAGRPKPIEDFIHTIILSGAKLIKFKLSSNVSEQLYQNIMIENLSAFGDLANDPVLLSALQSESKFLDKILHIDKAMMINMNTRMSTTIIPFSTIYITMEFDE